MKIFRKMFALVSLSISKDSLDDIENRNDQGENSFHTEKRNICENRNICGIAYFVYYKYF